MFVIIPFILIFVFGYLLTLILINEFSFIGRIGLSYLLGLGLFTFIVFCYSSVGIKITIVSIIWSLTILNILLCLLLKKLKIKPNIHFMDIFKISKNVSIIELFIAGLILFIGFVSLIQTLYYPVTVWDALALYDFRAKIITEFGYFTQIANNYSYFSQYPLLISLAHTIVYLYGGKYPQFVYSLMYISFLFVFCGSLREFSSRKISLLSTLIIASVPIFFEHSTFAYTNLPYAVYISLGTIYIFMWIVKKKTISYLIVAGLLTALSTWSRSSEPFWVVNFLVVFAYSLITYKDFIINLLCYSLSFFPIKWSWAKVYNNIVGRNISNISLITSEVTNISNMLFRYQFDKFKLFEVFMFIYNNVIKTWYPILAVFIFFLLINLFKLFKNKISVFLIFILLYFCLLIYGTYIYSFGISYWDKIPGSARRMAMFFFPLFVFYIALSVSELAKDNRTK